MEDWEIEDTGEDVETPLSDISTELSDISSELGTISSDLSDLKREVSWLPWQLLTFFIGGMIGWLFLGDLNFSLPDSYPEKIKYEEVSNGRKYYIIYNENFSGIASYDRMDSRVVFSITNTSKAPVNFKDAHFWLWTKNEGHGLQLVSVENRMYDNLSYILNPYQSITFYCEVPKNRPQLQEIKGFSISNLSVENIRFGYHKMSWWDHGRWWLFSYLN